MPHRPPMPALGFLTSLAVAGAVLVLVAPAPPTSPAALPAWVADAPPEVALINLATFGAWLCLAWVALAALGAFLNTIPGRTGRVAGRIVAATVPAALRRTVETALGIAVATAPVVGVCGSAPPAWADGRPPTPTWSVPSLDRPAAQVAAPQASAPASRATTSSSPSYVVRAGDCLWSIAADRLGSRASNGRVASTWPRWYAANRTVIGPDPNIIRPGQRLHVPESASGVAR
jgi:LysM repeat protein